VCCRSLLPYYLSTLRVSLLLLVQPPTASLYHYIHHYILIMSPRSEEVMESESVDVTDNNNKNNKRTSPAVRDASDNELDIDQDNDIESDNGSSAYRPKRARKTSTDGVCDDSGLTEDDRRILRRNQRRLHDIIRNDKREEVLQQGDELDFLEKVRQRNNELFQDVKYTREAVLDAENVHLVAQKYVQQVDRLVQVSRV